MVAPPAWKICSSKWVHLPPINFRGENKKYLKSPPSHYLQGFINPRWLFGFFPSTVWWGRIGVSLEGSCNLLLGGWTNPIRNIYVRQIGSSPHKIRMKTKKNWNHHHKPAVVTVAGWGVDPMDASPFTIYVTALFHWPESFSRNTSARLTTPWLCHMDLKHEALEKGILRCPCWNCQGCKN